MISLFCWFDAANWSGSGNYPQAGEAVSIPSGSVLLTNETAELGSVTIANATLTFSNWRYNVVFRDCDIIRTAEVALDIQHGDRAAVRDIRFEDIRVEIDDFNPRPVYQDQHDMIYPVNPGDDYCPYLMVIIIQLNGCSCDQQVGIVRRVLFKDIAVTGSLFPPSYFKGADPEHNVDGVTIHNLRVNGRLCTSPEDAHLTLHPHVSDVTFVAEAP